MNNIKTKFSIKDLENLSGIKAHTIRIWEKRYDILRPMRTDTNIRYYDSDNLKKLLNVVLLHKHGYKISKIGLMSEERIPQMVKQIISEKSAKHHALNAFKLAMMNFDQTLFFRTYQNLLSEKSFSEVFYDVFLPLLDEIGLLWQSGTITPAHEHFMCNLVRQKIFCRTEEVQITEPLRTDRTFILFLPQLEMHEMGLMYLHYEITSRGYRSLYLGEGIPISSLREMKNLFPNITFVSYFTVEPKSEEVESYLHDLYSEVMDDSSELWIFGRRSQSIEKSRPKLTVFSSFKLATDLL
ncbi:MerR family transcriptional regulator [Flavobacterium sp. MAH-1]|uniref:MerR family transcriptional regulator n=1 Tax=Flavobacterium agri TaxID=2743471 RepID=A0A7Y8Y437_9FLAO|nr:MerR family transcriptional regulator [Flavobacterium agri]NUY81983.1 MerR family transcriptional regulator [Flavobacterium agri]NYA72007.1 MerR family transcriptional regulator [Flavobacterium agri]